MSQITNDWLKPLEQEFKKEYYRDLFYKDDMMTEFSFNSGTKLNYNIEIVGIDEERGTATISITNK